MRAAQNQAQNLENTDASTAAGYGSTAASLSSVLTPFLEREMNSPAGISQQDQTAMLSAAEGGAGGLAGGLETKANERAAATGNESGFGTAEDDIAREREKAAAGAGEGVAAQSAETKLKQQQEGEEGLQGLYGTDVGAQLKSLGMQDSAINTEVNAGSHGWFQNMTNLIASIRGGGMSPGASPGGGDAPMLDTTGGSDPLMLNAPNVDLSGMSAGAAMFPPV